MGVLRLHNDIFTAPGSVFGAVSLCFLFVCEMEDVFSTSLGRV